jgi:hypothetical protein
MAKLAEGLFQNIRGFGRQDPTQPARQFAQASPYKQMGTTDPLARRVGSLFGNLGVDTSYMQTGEERAGAAMTEASKGQFESPEGRMIAMLEAQLPTLRPQAQMEAVDKIRQLRGIEQARSEKERQKREEELILSASAESNQRTNIDLANAIKDAYPNVASALIRGDSEAKAFAFKFLENKLDQKDVNKADIQFGAATDRAEDKNGNQYFLKTKQNPNTGSIDVVYTPIGKAPEYDASKQGDLKFISRLGETVDQKTQREIEAEDQIEWLNQRADILLETTRAPEVISKAERAIEALENINTSGFDASLKTVTDFVGVTEPDVGVFNASVSDFILESLGQLGANPTEGERKFLIEASASLGTSKEVNKALLRRVKNTFTDIVGRGKWLTENPKATRDEYANWMLSPTKETIIDYDSSGKRIN